MPVHSDQPATAGRDLLLRLHPEEADAILDRHAIAEQHCRQRGWSLATLTYAQILEIRELPEWQQAGSF